MQNNRLILRDTAPITWCVFFSNYDNTFHAHLETNGRSFLKWARARNEAADLECAGDMGSGHTQARDQGANGLPHQQCSVTPHMADA